VQVAQVRVQIQQGLLLLQVKVMLAVREITRLMYILAEEEEVLVL
jgi:hypothetical protein